TVHEWIAGGVLGRIHSVEARMVTSAVRHRNPEHYLFNAAVSGGGILSWLGCHWLDLIRYLTGLEVEAAGAITGNVGNPPVEVEEIAALSLRFAGGAIGTLHAAYVLPEGYETYLGVRGELGWIRWDPTGNVIEAKSQHPSWRDEPRRTLRPEKMQFPGYGTDGRSALLTWLAAIRGEAARPAADQRDALRTLEVIDAAYASANSGRLTSVRDSLAAR
ncbi:MAG TPA: Gfo/Idh/MocA family oxidoreductase, partial [Limnochordia bacterium]|nr:Gfo/Idh/MocA family oxidoreductase [Limnochordia bacterium]